MSADADITMDESRLLRAPHSRDHTRIHNPGYRSTCSYGSARPMSGRVRKQACPSSCRCPGLS